MIKTEYRVSWMMWPHSYPDPHPVERITDDEESARDQYQWLLSMRADHELRPCDEHVWAPTLESRLVETGPWEPIE